MSKNYTEQYNFLTIMAKHNNFLIKNIDKYLRKYEYYENVSVQNKFNK